MAHERIQELFTALGVNTTLFANGGLALASPIDGAALAILAQDSAETLAQKIETAKKAQSAWKLLARAQHATWLEAYSAALKANRELLAEIIHLDSGKTMKESLGEIDGSADIILKTIKDATLPELGGMTRKKERPAAGVVGLITSFNFPAVVAHWTLAPAMLAGNAVVWKPSEKTPLIAYACKALFDKAGGGHGDLLQIAIGGREVGNALVSSESVDMVSATGSVAMGQGIRAALAKKKNNAVPPVLELGGNNGVIISDKISDAHLQFAAQSILSSFLGTTGQRCTNTRRVIVQGALKGALVEALKTRIEAFLKTSIRDNAFDPANEFGYGPLIDEDAFKRFTAAQEQAAKEGGTIIMGRRLFGGKGFTVEPALAVMPKHSAIMSVETFAPILFITTYNTFDEALEMVNLPANAGLVGGIYTQSQKEADLFAACNQAGHCVINSPKGTGTPAFGMGFGGNKDSGNGEILNAADPLQAFTRPGAFSRIAQNKDVAMDKD